MKYFVILVLLALGSCTEQGTQKSESTVNEDPININNTTYPSDAPITEVNPTTKNGTITTTVPPPTNLTTTLEPPTTTKSTTSPPTPTTTKVPTSTTKPTPAPSPTTKSSTTSAPTVTTSTTEHSTVKPEPLPVTTAAPAHNRKFDGPSFVGGIVLALGLVAIGFVAFKFYKNRTELNYHTL